MNAEEKTDEQKKKERKLRLWRALAALTGADATVDLEEED